MWKSLEDLRDEFTYHPPTEVTKPKYDKINEAAFALAKVIFEECPGSPLQTLAIRAVQDAKMKANAAIATQKPK